MTHKHSVIFNGKLLNCQMLTPICTHSSNKNPIYPKSFSPISQKISDDSSLTYQINLHHIPDIICPWFTHDSPISPTAGGVSCQVAPSLRGGALRTPRWDGRGQDLRWRLREQRAGHAPWPNRPDSKPGKPMDFQKYTVEWHLYYISISLCLYI